ncbi:hypothetical protein CONPUDRAFT_86592 [Coniophora puteana RWD-64-598 SS2]|uniref:FMR1-interacting protein 1 conserved domain-containing protein n=1 Tax=Coniophora puteana (strain RWD-64-598) TaxID=741705 RepID=A0A5M3N701_CONPW|nr:uncharacterized protein CONPUDRAFT_86592 [Coniophora puteana RWD-64-598 SS2]EIW86631.1 hypothetical protein CONPUDRAFT_86592 [Coniophora puteana RWD-64-598 SS2]
MPQHRNNNSWYQPGNARCSHPGCSFMGSHKSLELHMMDRHLIFPPGWEKRRKSDEWDADPSLKGKPMSIQGTSIVLDTPEAIDDWITERKKRFPTAQKVEDRKRKLEEARARGQLVPGDFSRPLKRPKNDDFTRSDRPRGTRGSFGRGRGRGRGGGQPVRTNAPPQSATCEPPAIIQQNAREAPPNIDVKTFHESSDDDDGAPEEVTSKAAPPTSLQDDRNDRNPAEDKQEPPEPARKPAPKRPKPPPHNPFASRPVLLRNLLLPEIRMTVSNLSQAIRFIVDNDFLDNVELKAGEANDKMIEEVDGSGESIPL